MNKLNKCLLVVNSDTLSLSDKVTILEVLVGNMDIDTVSGMARKECKSPNGIKESKQYRKIMIGCQKMVIKGLIDNTFPW